jgi:murein DD-endopeptidase MepM/ murein hydrolase activator NlpD
MEKNKKIVILVSAAIVLAVAIYWIVRPEHSEVLVEPEVERLVAYGIDYTDMNLVEGQIASGVTLSELFGQYGIGPVMIDKTDKAAADVFSLRKIKAGHKYSAFLTTDSIPELKHFVYEDNVRQYLHISYEGDSVAVQLVQKDVDSQRKMAHGTIESSLWNSMVAAGMNPGMIKDFENIYQWTINFYLIQPGDSFTMIYDELSIEGEPIGAGGIWGAVFNHGGKDIYAIPFRQEGRLQYWDEKGNSLRKSMLKTPVKYSRISSRFSSSRLHPVYKYNRAHRGVDYAAPSGTPVHAVADGTVTTRAYQRGGAGNYVRIRHSSGYVTEYMHLSRFGSGITVGKRVSQGQTIGYVGSTGASTGPHLHYGVLQNGKHVNPLTVTSQPVAPISKGNMADFEMVRDRVMAELGGTLGDKLPITQVDSLEIYRRPVPVTTVVQ